MASNAFVHCELSADDVGAAKKFYKKLFDWKLSDMGPGMGNYTMIDVGKKMPGGGMTKKMMPGQQTAWLSYVAVKSVKKTMAKAEKAGAKAVVPFQEIGEMGAIGIFVDPQGAALGVWELAKPKKKGKKGKKGKKK
jgi:predicted enzyme related to lactoylglutathione lyase